ncbi:hypothetical protein AB0I98_42810 [Streptomyces sp. NPDC050211]|uniref:hypothetical protein n=1 Tax=Streptomyces sp. NPDC050211 TaxID=3154932 RepID=UPI00343CEB31
MSENSDNSGTSTQQPATPAPRRRFTVQRGGCGCEGKPAPAAAARAAGTEETAAQPAGAEQGEGR